MSLRLEIESGQVESLDDIHDRVAELPNVPEWFGRNLDALAELAFFLKQPLDIVVHHPAALERRLGSRNYKALMQALEDIRDSNPGDGRGDCQPVTLTIKQQ
jgi:RNAse (barnase) inhibitor barstar